MLRKIYIDHPKHEKLICTRLKQGLELACAHNVDIVFTPEMLGTTQTEEQTGNYSSTVSRFSSGKLCRASASSFAVISLPPTTKDCSASSSAKYLSQT